MSEHETHLHGEKPTTPHKWTCPSCANGTVLVSNTRFENGHQRRRKVCLRCKHRFTTYEITDVDFEKLTMAVKSLGAIAKILISATKA